MYSSKRTLDLKKNPRIEIMLNSINFEHATILDIGCNDGTFLSLIKNKNNNLFGIEANNFAAQEAIKKGIDVKQFFFDDKTQMPFDDNFFDVIVAGEIIEHIYDTDFFLDEIKRLLKPGGQLIISTPNIASLGRRIFLFIGKNPIIEVSPNESDSSGHIRYFTNKTLAALLYKHNFIRLQQRSDIVNLSKDGSFKSRLLASIFPGIGQSIIAVYQKNG